MVKTRLRKPPGDARTPEASDARDAERRLVLAYAPAAARGGMQALLALDDALGAVLRTTREPAIGQMRLAWWHQALEALDQRPAPAEPVLQQLARSVLPHGVTGAQLARQIDGWDVLIEERTLDRSALERFARGRGGALFEVAAQLLGRDANASMRVAGEGWALADLARHLTDAAAGEAARTLAAERLTDAFAARWSPALRPLGVLALAARMDLNGPPVGSPRRLLRFAAHRLTGR